MTAPRAVEPPCHGYSLNGHRGRPAAPWLVVTRPTGGGPRAGPHWGGRPPAICSVTARRADAPRRPRPPESFALAGPSELRRRPAASHPGPAGDACELLVGDLAGPMLAGQLL